MDEIAKHEQPRKRKNGRVSRASLGFSLVEMLTAATILSLLALMAVPFAQTAKDREREIILKNALSRIREAIHLYAYCESNGDEDLDGFLEEDAAGDPDHDGVSDDDRDGLPDEDGAPNFPGNLSHLVSAGYLSQIPLNPMVPLGSPASHWTTKGVTRRHVKAPDASFIDRLGMYDIRANCNGTGLDGSRYDTW